MNNKLKLFLFALFLPVLMLMTGGAGAETGGNFWTSGGTYIDYEGITSPMDSAYGVAVDTFTAGGPYIYVAANVQGAGTSNDWLLVKYNASSVIVSSRVFDYGAGSDKVMAVAVDGNGGVYFAGFVSGASQNLHIRKYDTSFTIVSSVTFSENSSANAITVGKDGNIYAAGRIDNSGYDDILAVKFTQNLQLISSATVPGGLYGKTARGIAINSSGDVIIVGNTVSAAPDTGVLVKFNSNLSGVPSQFNDTSANGDVLLSGVAVDSSDNVYAVGQYGVLVGKSFYVAKYLPGLTQKTTFWMQSQSNTNDAGKSIAVRGSEVYAVGLVRANLDITFSLLFAKLDTLLTSASYFKRTVALYNSDYPYALALGTSTLLYASGSKGSGPANCDIATYGFDPSLVDLTAPSAVTDLRVSVDSNFTASTGWTWVKLNWTAPGNNAFTGDLSEGSSYVLQCSSSNLGPWNNINAVLSQYVQCGSTSAVRGSPMSASFWLQENQMFYFRLWYADESGNWSVPAQAQFYTEIPAGSPYRIEFLNPNLTIEKDKASGPIGVVLKDYQGMVTKSTYAVVVGLSSFGDYYYDYTSGTGIYPPDATGKFSLTPDFAVPVSTIIIPAGQSYSSFYYMTSTSPYASVTMDYSFKQEWNRLYVNVMASGGGILNSGVHKGDYSSNKNIIMGSDELAYIDFNLSDSVSNWQVLIATAPDSSNYIWSYSGYGYPSAGMISWNASYLNYCEPGAAVSCSGKVPSGTYYVTIRLGGDGGISDKTLTVTVQSLEISGRVTDGSANGIPYVDVMAYGPSYSYATTDLNGYYKLTGLIPGTYQVSFNKFGYAQSMNNAVVAGGSLNVTLQQPSVLMINATRDVSGQIQNNEQWGGVNIYKSDYSGDYWGTLHFETNVSTSDNGMWNALETPNYEIDNSSGYFYDGGKWTKLELSPGTYYLKAELNGYVPVSQTITILEGEASKAINIHFAVMKTAYGTVQLSEPPQDSWGSYVSVEAIPQGYTWGTAWGWAWIPYGSSSATYTIGGLDAGVYTIKVSASGYRRSAAQVSILAGDVYKQLSDVTLSPGGGLTGTVTIDGDSTQQNSNYIYLNAWSPDSYSYGWASVPFTPNSVSASSTFAIRGLDDGTYWVNSWLQGFELQGAIGWNGVKTTVSNGVGSLNLVFKKYSGVIKCTFKVPGNDYANLRVSVNGPNMWISDQGVIDPTSGLSFDQATGVLTISGLGTGFYQIKGLYTVTTMEKTRAIMAVNGQTREGTIDLTGQTHRVYGKIGISQNNPPVGYSDISVLVDTVPLITDSYGSHPNINMMLSTTTFRVYAVNYSNMDQLATLTGTANPVATPKQSCINKDGSFSITGLMPGIYNLVIPAVELDGNTSNGKETTQIEKRVIVNGSDVEVNDISVSKGYSISGLVKLPAGESAMRNFYIGLFNASKFKVDNYMYADWSPVIYQEVSLGLTSGIAESSGSFTLKGISPGDYVLTVKDNGYTDADLGFVPRQYANSSITVKVDGSDLTGQNIQLSKGGKITLKLRDADSGTVITPKNKDRSLPQSYTINAIANPWIEGGWGSLMSLATLSGTAASEEFFELSFLPEAQYDVMLGQSSYGFMPMSAVAGTAFGSGNQTSYAAKTVSGVKVKSGQTVDLGVVDIKQGITVTGTVKDKAGSGIPNIPVVAVPALTNEWSSELRGFTDINGNYSIVGLDPDTQYYDFIACPRIDLASFGGYYFFGSGGLSYGEKVKSMVKIETTPVVDFVLLEANGSVSGKVVTEDGGYLQHPDDFNIPEARIFMQPENTFPRTNPLGDIVGDTEVDGTFAIEALPAGAYNMIVVSGGYASYFKTVVLTDGALNLGTITLKKGAKLGGSVTKLDGKNPSTSELRSIVAATDDLSEILFGSLTKSGDKAISAYEINGFQPGSSYNIMFLTPDDELIPAVLGYSVAYSSYVKTDYPITFQISAPAVFSRVRKDAGVFTVNFELTGAMRNSVPTDSDLASIISRTEGAGTLADAYMSPTKKALSCTYKPPAGENKFTLRLHGYSKAVNPLTQSEFEIDESFQYYAGIGAKNRVRISNMRGGKVTLDGDSSNVIFSPGSFAVNSSTVSVNVDFSRADSLEELLTAPARGRAPRLVIPRPSQSYPSGLFDAMKLAQAAGITPFSSFYDIMLPSGISRTLKKNATLNIQYAAGSDPTLLNVYYYDATNNVYLLEKTNRQVDTTEQTIEISINHTSVFVLIASNAPVIQGTSYSGPLFVYNFPNPFNLKPKDVTLEKTSTFETKSINGTMIHYGFNTEINGEVEIAIYNVAGELVRTIYDGYKNGGTHFYTEWDGKNDAGAKVASGVYIARFTVDKKNEKFIKMAVIK